MFSKGLRIFWPIRARELKIFIPLASIMFCILCNFGVVRSLKDSIIVPSLGAEVISFLKLWFVLPSAILFTLTYAKLSNHFSIQKIYYMVLTFFCAVFVLFAYYLYPNQDLCHPSAETVDYLTAQYPYFQWFIKIIGKWSYALVYVFADLWSAVVINLLFWQFCSYVVDHSTAKRFYPTFGMIGNLGLVFGGTMLVYLSDISILPHAILNVLKSGMVEGSNSATYNNLASLQAIVLLIVTISLISGLLFILVNKILNKEYKGTQINSTTSLSIMDSIKLIISSKYILRIVVMVICYGLAINILEGPWKAQIKKLYPEFKDYIAFMGKFNIALGSTAIVFAFIGNFLFFKFRWLVSALFSPLMIGVTGLAFFFFIVFGHNFSDTFLDPIFAAVIIGSIQNIISKSSKYSIFDATKEVAYIPLSLELKSKGKATVEIIGSKTGKSLGAILQSGIFMLFPAFGFSDISFYLMIVFIIVIIVWIMDVLQLNKQYSELISDEKIS